jgi:hypothetical protein
LSDENNEQSPSQEQLNFEYFNRIVGGNSILFNPLWMNNLLKMQDTRPEKFSRENIIEWMKNPAASENQLRELNQYFINTSTYYKRVIDYFSTMLTFDHVLVPYGVEASDLKTQAFKRSRKKVFDFLDQFHVKDEFYKIMRIVMGEDTYFGYIRSEGKKFAIQKMPTKYCKLVNRNEDGYVYAFDMNYFLLPGVNIDDYSPDFKVYFDEMKKGQTNTGTYYVILDPDKSFVFKFDETIATIIPPLLGLFLDVLEISEYKDLIKSRAVLDSYMLLHQKIPMRTDKDAKNDSFLISLDNAAKFHANTKANTPEGVKVVTTPMDMNPIKIDRSQNKDSIIGLAESQFYKTAGISETLFAESQNQIGIKYSVQTDETFVLHMYRQFERWINRQLDKVSGKFKFRLRFPDITYYNKPDKRDAYKEAANAGIGKTMYAATLDLSPSDFLDLADYENSLGLEDVLKPLASAHTQSGNNKGGAPQKKETDLTDSGSKTRSSGENEIKVQQGG